MAVIGHGTLIETDNRGMMCRKLLQKIKHDLARTRREQTKSCGQQEPQRPETQELHMHKVVCNYIIKAFWHGFLPIVGEDWSKWRIRRKRRLPKRQQKTILQDHYATYIYIKIPIHGGGAHA